MIMPIEKLSNSGHFTNVLSLLINCSTDNSVMLILENVTNNFWVPSVKTDLNSSWSKLIIKEAQEITATKLPVRLLRLSKIWYPRPEGSLYLYHCVFQCDVDANIKNKTKTVMGKYRGKVKWIAETDLLSLSENNSLKSPEILEWCQLSKGTELPQLKFEIPEDIISCNNMCEVTKEILVSGKTTDYQQLVQASGIDKLAQEDIYRALFFNSCYPAIYMNLKAFSTLIPNLGWPKSQIPFLFKCADVTNRFGLSFREFLYFLAIVDPNTGHAGASAELRCRYIFKYYDRDEDRLLKPEEFRNLIIDLRKSKKLLLDAGSITKDLQDTYKALGVLEKQPLNLKDFLRGVCDLKIRGTSHLFRSVTGIIKYLKDNERSISSGEQGVLPVKSVLELSGEQCRVTSDKQSSIPIQKNFDYEIAFHAVKIQKSGQAININEMSEIREAVSSTYLKQPINEKAKRISLNIFSQRSVSNEVLKGLRYLTTINNVKDTKTSYIWGQLDPLVYGRQLIQICNQVREIFRNEPRLLQLTSPVYIMGDLHGNIADLLYFERTLWHIGPGLSPCNLLFLGDYVDRGSYSMEVISYLFSYKLQNPNKVSLLRGNHEIREVQKMFTFYKECHLKLGDKLGNEVWNAVNNAFDTMPIAATVDGKIFCCHGGVPPPWLCPVISAINDIPTVLNQPNQQSSLAWELMWNDPVK
ncbi:hypothetical protein ABEB36_009828 [Hypothenemus hampei]